MNWAAEHVVGVAQGAPEDIIADLRANFEGECSEVGMYLAMARVAHREGYPEIGLYWEKAAFEEAEHAAKFAELLGEVVTDSKPESCDLTEVSKQGQVPVDSSKTDVWKVCAERVIYHICGRMIFACHKEAFDRFPLTAVLQSRHCFISYPIMIIVIVIVVLL